MKQLEPNAFLPYPNLWMLRLWLWFSGMSLAISSSLSCTEFAGLKGYGLTVLFNPCFGEILGEHDQVMFTGAFADTGTLIGINAVDEGANELGLEAQEIGVGNGDAGGSISDESQRNLSICSLTPSSTGRSNSSSAK